MEGDMISTADLFTRNTQQFGARSLPELVSTGLASARLGTRRPAAPHAPANTPSVKR
jgi:hypothetical protein